MMRWHRCRWCWRGPIKVRKIKNILFSVIFSLIQPNFVVSSFFFLWKLNFYLLPGIDLFITRYIHWFFDDVINFTIFFFVKIENNNKIVPFIRVFRRKCVCNEPQRNITSIKFIYYTHKIEQITSPLLKLITKILTIFDRFRSDQVIWRV